ncbi:MAG TPA: hypothetical protein EYG51_03490 [Pseudomonadales bacterium]|nr:hypothetical protein [Pseudomonadales bacterium]
MARKKDVNRYKKVYASVRRTPRIVDIGTGVFEDLNLMKKTYPPLIRSTVYASASWRPPGPAGAPPAPPGVTYRWLEIRGEGDAYSAQLNSDSDIWELRTGYAGHPPADTGTPLAPIATGIYPNWITYADPATQTTTSWPDGTLAAPPFGSGVGIYEEATPNTTWPELDAYHGAGPSSVPQESIMWQATLGGAQDIVTFYGPIAVGTVCTIAVREFSNYMIGFPTDLNVTFSVRVWTVDPTTSGDWATGVPPADSATPPANVIATGLSPMVATSPMGAYAGLPGNTANGGAANGWSLYGLASNWSAGASPVSDQITDLGPYSSFPAGNPRNFHVNATVATGTGPSGGFVIL